MTKRMSGFARIASIVGIIISGGILSGLIALATFGIRFFEFTRQQQQPDLVLSAQIRVESSPRINLDGVQEELYGKLFVNWEDRREQFPNESSTESLFTAITQTNTRVPVQQPTIEVVVKNQGQQQAEAVNISIQSNIPLDQEGLEIDAHEENEAKWDGDQSLRVEMSRLTQDDELQITVYLASGYADTREYVLEVFTKTNSLPSIQIVPHTASVLQEDLGEVTVTAQDLPAITKPIPGLIKPETPVVAERVSKDEALPGNPESISRTILLASAAGIIIASLFLIVRRD